MGKFRDLTGQKFGRWTVIKRVADRYKACYWLCRCDCGTEREVYRGALCNGSSRSCGCTKREVPTGDKHPAWKGGSYKDNGGYILVSRYGHPNAYKSGYLFEHTFIMSEHLGRPLKKSENVHHKNGIKDDNRIENLELWASSQPSGQRVSDLVSWAKDILREHAPSRIPAKHIQYKYWRHQCG